MEQKTYTATFTTCKYDDFILDDFVRFCYEAKTEKSAVDNFKRLLKKHESRLSMWQLIKLLFSK